MNARYTNIGADVKIYIADDTDVVYSILNQNNPISLACQENPDDSLYSTLHGKDAFGTPTAPSTAGKSENGDTVYSTLHGKEVLFTTTTNRKSRYDCDNDDDNCVNDDLGAIYSKIDRGNRDARSENIDNVYSNVDKASKGNVGVNPSYTDLRSLVDVSNTAPSDQGIEDVDDDEPVYATVNKTEVAPLESKDVSRPMSVYYNTQDMLQLDQREISSVTDDIVSEMAMEDQNDTIYMNQETSSLFDFVDDPSALYSTINK